MLVLQAVGLDVLPQGVDDHRPGLGVHPEQARQAGVQFELHRLVVEHQQHCAFDILVARPLHLETVRLLRGRRAVPLHMGEKERGLYFGEGY